MGIPPTSCIWGCAEPDEIARYLRCPRMYHHLAMHPAWRRRHLLGSPIIRLGFWAASECGRAGSELSRENALRRLHWHSMCHKAKHFAQKTPMSLERACDIR
eukprot:9221318-Pyramimonas_sp.AAC.1